MSERKFSTHLILYIIIGFCAAIIDYGTFFIFEKRFKNISPELASVLGQSAGFLFAFFLNTYYNFKKTDKLFKRFLSYFVITLVGMVISTLAIHYFKNDMNIFILKLFCLIGVSILQFFLNKIITYKKV